MHQPQEPFPLARIAMEFLRASGEALEFAPEGTAALRAALDALFTLDVDPRPALEDLLRLSQVLEIERRSPAAAALIAAELSRDARVIRALGGAREDETVKRAKARFLGRERHARAPEFGAEAPPGTMRASALQVQQVEKRRPRRPQPRQR
jgi:hypothetical protein